MPASLLSSKSFGPEIAVLMKQAFDAAWQSLKDCGSVDVAPYRAEWARRE
jgi:hypothetical protein